MAEPPKTEADLLTKVQQVADQERLRQLRQLAAGGAPGLQQAKEALQSSLGADHPLVRTIDQAGQEADALAQWARQTVQRMERHPEIRPGDWVVRGRVLDAKGAPVAGVTVKLADREGKFAPRLAEATTDQTGEFVLGVQPSQVPELFLEQPDLRVTVLDARRQPLATSDQPLRAVGTGPAPIEIRLPAGSAEPGPKPDPKDPKRGKAR